MKTVFFAITLATCLSISWQAHSAVVTFSAADFTASPVFSEVETFDFAIDIAGSLSAGSSYLNPTLNSVNYSVSGTLAMTPSGFPAFALQRTISGTDFYAQGSSLGFSISALADLSDGLQVSELTAAGAGLPVFVFDGRELGTGRYHPALVELYADGTGRILNSNNSGGINPASGEEVDVNFGEEYITNLAFSASDLTLVKPAVVPLPAAAWLFGSALLALGGLRARVRTTGAHAGIERSR